MEDEKQLRSEEKAGSHYENLLRDYNYIYRNFDYPENLMIDLFYDREKGVESLMPTSAYPSDFDASLNYLLHSLPEKERMVIEARYEKKLTLQDLGDMLGVTHERARQILGKALQTLRSPRPRMVLMNGLKEYYASQGKIKYAQGYQKGYEDCRRDAAEKKAYRDFGMSFQEVDEQMRRKMTLTVEELDLSVRSYRSLTAAGCRTVGDLLEMNGSDFFHVRNLGVKSVEEILGKLEELNFDLSRTREEYSQAKKRGGSR